VKGRAVRMVEPGAPPERAGPRPALDEVTLVVAEEVANAESRSDLVILVLWRVPGDLVGLLLRFPPL
jgi:hypothetical protein